MCRRESTIEEDSTILVEAAKLDVILLSVIEVISILFRLLNLIEVISVFKRTPQYCMVKLPP